MNLKGKIEKILPVETGVSKADKQWSKQSIVINNGDNYNPLVCISFFGDDKIKMLKDFKAGIEVEVSINLSSREHKGKWYSQVDGWKIQISSNETVKEPVNTDGEPDSLPF